MVLPIMHLVLIMSSPIIHRHKIVNRLSLKVTREQNFALLHMRPYLVETALARLFVMPEYTGNMFEKILSELDCHQHRTVCTFIQRCEYT